MARKIDTGSEPPVHTAIQAMIGRAWIIANRDHKRVAVACDLANDQLIIVDLGGGCSDESEYIQIFEPGAVARTIMIRKIDSESSKMSIRATEPQIY